MKSTFILLFFILISLITKASSYHGYIITNSNDTIKGYIKVINFNPRTNGLSLKGINLEWNYIEASFKEENTKRFKTYTPDQIKGYSFKYKNDQYYFLSERIPLRSIFRTESNRKHFVLLIYKDKDMKIFKHQKYINYIHGSSQPIYMNFVRLNDGTIYKLDGLNGLK